MGRRSTAAKGTMRGAVVALVVVVAIVAVGPGTPARTPELPTAGLLAAQVGPDPGELLSLPERNAVPDGGRAQSQADSGDQRTVWDLPAGSLVMNPASGRNEVIDFDVAREAVLFGDSQAGTGPESWVQKGLSSNGYKVRFLGAGGTGFVAGTPQAANYLDAVVKGKVVLPYGNPALVVVQGGGNDAAQGASDTQIVANATRLFRELKASYPDSEFLFIGTLARGSAAGGGRRSQVDALLAGFAKSNGIRFIGAGDWLTKYSLTKKMADGVHLNAAGHQDLSKVLAGQVKALGLQGPPSARAARQP